MNKTYIIISLLLILLIVLWSINNKSEHATMTTQSENAVKNIANVYSDISGTLTINNLQVTGNINFAQFKGIIVVWSGTTENIPNGWGLCDGSTYTALDGTQLKSPDLRSMFVLGASKPGTPSNQTVGGPNGQPSIPYIAWLTPKTVGEFGGEETHILQLDEMPPHSHATNVVVAVGNTNTYSSWGNPIQAPSNIQSVIASTNLFDNLVPGNTVPITSYTGGNANITTTDATLSTIKTTPHQNMPPYYALAYIIKL